ncbi:MAG: class I SAM-dependent methyltransferase [Promethearchaeota archaeon]
MSFEFFTDDGYRRAFDHFGGIRKRIAEIMHELCAGPADMILDIPSGHGYFAAEVASSFASCRCLGVGLPSDVDSHFRLRDSDVYPQEVWSRIEYLCCDAVQLSLADSSFDLVVNFLGLEDIKMTRGEEGVVQALSEMVRVLKADGLLQISISEYGDLPEERVAREAWSATGLNVEFAPRDWYVEALEGLEMKVTREEVLTFPKKMTVHQAKEELRFACEEAPKTFASFGVTAVSFKDVWSEFGDLIAKHGMAYWSRIRVIILKKAQCLHHVLL